MTDQTRRASAPLSNIAHPAVWPLPAKALVTMAVVMMSLGLLVAGGQVVVHDIIPTLFTDQADMTDDHAMMGDPASGRGDLFGEIMAQAEKTPLYKTDEFIFALKFSHVHIFGMSAIFILMGTIVFFLSLSPRVKTWLIVLPFVGIVVDLAAVWLKLFVSPVFFWLHMPGGVLFVIVFVLDFFFVIAQLWFTPVSKIGHSR